MGGVHFLPNSMDGALYPGRQPGPEIEVACHRRGLVVGGLEDALGQEAVVDFSNGD
jgi:hypothetical protein